MRQYYHQGDLSLSQAALFTNAIHVCIVTWGIASHSFGSWVFIVLYTGEI